MFYPEHLRLTNSCCIKLVEEDVLHTINENKRFFDPNCKEITSCLCFTLFEKVNNSYCLKLVEEDVFYIINENKRFFDLNCEKFNNAVVRLSQIQN